jgi:hypothetical protein
MRTPEITEAVVRLIATTTTNKLSIFSNMKIFCSFFFFFFGDTKECAKPSMHILRDFRGNAKKTQREETDEKDLSSIQRTVAQMHTRKPIVGTTTFGRSHYSPPHPTPPILFPWDPYFCI